MENGEDGEEWINNPPTLDDMQMFQFYILISHSCVRPQLEPLSAFASGEFNDFKQTAFEQSGDTRKKHNIFRTKLQPLAETLATIAAL